MTLANVVGDCGEYQVTWYQSLDGGAKVTIDTSNFIIDTTSIEITVPRADSGPYGDYLISYEVSLIEFPNVPQAEQSSAFQLTVLDVCSRAEFTGTS